VRTTVATAALTVAALAALAGCFRPRFKDDLACGADGQCPPGTTCGADDKCHGAGGFDAAIIDAGDLPDAAPDARVDAMPVACTGDGDCATPPDHCYTAGTCDVAHSLCVFPSVDCSGMSDECNLGTCDPATGCVLAPAHQDQACGKGKDCGPFGGCDGFADECDSTGTLTRTCTTYTCQAGTCTGVDGPDTAPCTRKTEDNPCGQDTVTGCGVCDNPNDVCALSGEMGCTCTTFACKSDACTPNATSCAQPCTRVTNGTPCGEQQCSPDATWTICCMDGACGVPCGSCQ
jgi:hypothetical protein